MAPAGRRRGRRDNGLDAPDWRAVEDLDPRVSEEVLTVLAARGIAAYVQPAVDVDPVTRSATVPVRPTDRLFVDRARVPAARECLRELLGDGDHGGPDHGGPEHRGPEHRGPDHRGPDHRELDSTFAGIVAGFDRQVDPTAAIWPAAEELDPTGPRPDPADEPLPEPAGGPSHTTEPTLLDALDTFGTGRPDRPGGPGAPEDLPDRFVPPTPPPLPRLSRQAVWGGVAILGGLLLLLAPPDALPLERSTAMLLGFGAILGGAVALILRLRPGTDPDDPTGRRSDDGAQV